MVPYVDESDNEYSIHCLTEDDLRLIINCMIDVAQDWAKEPMLSQ